ncbi:MAG: acetylglutamate kinase [Verrucomicrobiota bacterium JB022]|nr:acetylglutamate kinase [Verrucomicrobiota bacterium JB022]
MIDIDIQTKTEVLLEALPYIQRFRDSIFVVKFGGSFMDTEQAQHGVSLDLAFLAAVGLRVVVVHGGGPAINQAMAEAKLEPVFINGLRVTDAATVKIVEQVLNGKINAGICDNLRSKGAQPAGVRGQDVLTCHRLTADADGQPVDLGYVGVVDAVDADAIQTQIDQGKLPVISPVAKDVNGDLHNVNADVAAAAVAAALGARRLVYLCDVPGLLRNPKDPSTLISTLPVEQVKLLKADGTIGKGMLPKVDSAVNAVNQGVHRVHFIDGRLPHSLLLEIFTDKGVGTEIVKTQD